MLSRNNSAQSNLSAAAAAAALKRASSQSLRDDSRQSPAAAATAAQISSRPPLRRRTSSMSERSFRAQSPEGRAKERRDRPASVIDTTPEKAEKQVKRRGSLTLPISLRPNSSEKKKAKGVAPGVIQPLPQQNQHKLKTSMRQDRAERERVVSPTHSAMKLPHQPGIGSSASSIRSFQTDLSSIAEDHPLDPGRQPSHPKASGLFPVKSALKGGSGPPSIISEAVSEESRSSLGAHDSRRTKQRVSFSDEQEQGQIIPNQVPPKPKMGYLRPENIAIVARTLSPPASPPLSPLLSPTAVPQTLPTSKTIDEIAEEKPFAEDKNVPVQPSKVVLPSQTNDEKKEVTPESASNEVPTDTIKVPPVTIHVSPSRSLRAQTRLPGAFPDPTPEPTPPSTSGSRYLDGQENGAPVATLDHNKASNSPQLADDLDLQHGLSLKALTLVPTRSGPSVSNGEKMERQLTNESGTSVYSDAVDGLPSESKATMEAVKEEIATNGDSGPSFVPVVPVPILSPTPMKPIKPPPVVQSAVAHAPTKSATTSKAPMKTTLRQNINGTANVSAKKSTPRSSSVPPASPTALAVPEAKPMRMSLRATDHTTTTSSEAMARGLMSLPRVERVPSDSSFKRLRPRNSSALRTTLRSPPEAEQRHRRQLSDSSSEIGRTGRASSIFGRFKRRESIDQAPATHVPIVGSRFRDSSDEDDDLLPPTRGIGRTYEDTASLPSPTLKKRSSFSQFFRRGSLKPDTDSGAVADEVKNERRRSSSGNIVVSKRTGKEKKFQGLRRLFRIKE